MTRRALVVHTRMPAFDRDAGSQHVDHTVRFLLESGWSVTFLSEENEQVAERRHAQRLRGMGVATHAGFDRAPTLLRSTAFDLALIAFWEPTARLLPLLREHAAGTRVVVNSIDLHFLRAARRLFGQDQPLDVGFGSDAAHELNTYQAVDAVLTVSEKERALLADFLGGDRVFTLPLAEAVARSPVPLDSRRGMFFVGNFRHLPNREAVEYLCGEVLPMLDRGMLERHPLTIIGNWFDEAKVVIDQAAPGVNVVGWVPSVQPYLEGSRIAVVPLLHGAGLKGKVIQSMMAYTPVVTTPVGAESLDLVQGEHALIATDTSDLAAGITRLLTDDDLWHRIAAKGAEHVDARHSIDLVRRRFLEIIERVMARPPRAQASASGGGSGFVTGTDLSAVRSRIQTTCEPGFVVLVASGGDPTLVDIGSQPCWHFPQGADGGWPGYEPVDGPAAVNHLEAQRQRGARYFALPKRSFSWFCRFPELHEHLDRTARRLFQDEHIAVYDLGAAEQPFFAEPPGGIRVQVVGTYSADRTGPPAALVAELDRSSRLLVDQQWRSDLERESDALPPAATADHVVFVSDEAILPSGFLDQLVATQRALDVDRLQPAHRAGPNGGPPVTERQKGTLAWEVDLATSLPVLAVRSGATLEGPVTLADTITVGLRRPIDAHSMDERSSDVHRVWVLDADGRPACYERPEPSPSLRISAVVATFERADLLRQCLKAFAAQTLDCAEFEVVVVDDGSEPSAVERLREEFAGELELIALRIEHGGRSAAKNLGVFPARAPLVLFFDDDDWPAPDYLERHVRAHEARPDEAVAVLGHTDWAPELAVTPLMHYVTNVDRLLFAYERLRDGQILDWRGFWEGRISCKRSLLVRHGLHDQRINYSIDIEMAARLASHGLRVVYDSSAMSVMARPLDTDAFCARTEAKGRAHAIIGALHPGTAIAAGFQLDQAVDHWHKHRGEEPSLRRRVAALELKASTDEATVRELTELYRKLFRLLHGKGAAGATAAGGPTEPWREDTSAPLPTTVHPFENTDPAFLYDGSPDGPSPPRLSITIPVWSRSLELADMARSTIDRVWEVSRIPTEVVVVDNGSPFETRLAAKVYRYPENKGVATGWNTGIRLASAPVVVVLNSDCLVEPGWDEALYEAATDGRRIAFPYTDHCDGLGFTRPDQAGTAGWCFMITKAVYEEVGVFDEWFNPAFCEDTDYWHRAWQLGVELTPVPAARVVHARRTTASRDSHTEWLLQGHRYKYGWKHGVDPLRAPPYYNREIAEYRGSVQSPGAT